MQSPYSPPQAVVVDSPVVTKRPPRLVRYGVAMLGVAFLIDLSSLTPAVNPELWFYANQPGFAAYLGGVALLLGGLQVLLIWKSLRGERWARVGIVLMQIASLLLFVFDPSAADANPTQVIVSSLSSALALIGVSLLFLPPSRAWFDRDTY